LAIGKARFGAGPKRRAPEPVPGQKRQSKGAEADDPGTSPFRSALWATATFGDWSDPEFRCYPSVVGLANRAGLSRRGAVEQLRQAERLGVLVLERSAGGGPADTHVYRFNVAKLHELNRQAPAPRAGDPCTSRIGPTHGVQGTPAPDADEQTSQQTKEQTTQPDHRAEHQRIPLKLVGLERQTGGEDARGSAVRRELSVRGVTEPTLSELARCPTITPEDVVGVWNDIQAGERPKKPAGVLIHRLQQKHGLKPSGRKRRSLSAGDAECVQQIERQIAQIRFTNASSRRLDRAAEEALARADRNRREYGDTG
jgi:hypothetical protein